MFASFEFKEKTSKDNMKVNKTLIYIYDKETFFWKPVKNYDKVTHKDEVLLTISDNLDIEYPKILNIASIKAYKVLPFLKGVEILHVGKITHDLDCSKSGIKRLIIDEVSMANEDAEDDYEDLRHSTNGRFKFLVGSPCNNPCTIKCENIEVKYCLNHTGKLTYDCKELTLDNGVGPFTSTCTYLIFRPSFYYQSVKMDVPNLESTWMSIHKNED